MRNIINKISRALQVVLLAPIKLPGKAVNILKYVAVGLGIIESVLDKGEKESEIRDQEVPDDMSQKAEGDEQIRKGDKVIVGYIDVGEESEEDEGKKESDE
ncbi:hypothetical protein FAZ19_05705 [Sphingobacterium alkalisoli]|uniref:Uncharacterized protein n=1 Tax=Sphingobacterium alkalisoli TaxID=1874115 RepID=A0A4U0H3Z5_9SPHI|nr:hypothetical protein [Sphingobacterium alkalisoli]TJY66417.1 hypothetical protein FAZ19_05705 [Sphingobacterium alkalisoli]GGH16527.1 hypothetical protein GCM10011418_18980 [Sphingobacterium alkalisoli]